MFLTLVAGNMVAMASDVIWYDGKKAVSYHIETEMDSAVKVVADLFTSDMKAVNGHVAVPADGSKAAIRIIEPDKAPVATVSQLKKKGVSADLRFSVRVMMPGRWFPLY